MQIDSHQIITLLSVALGGGAGVSVLVAGLKKIGWVKNLTHELVVLTSVLAGAAQFVLQFHSKLPSSVLGVSTVSIYGFSQLVYKFSGRINQVLSGVYGNKGSVSASTVSDASTTTSVDVQTTAAASSDAPVLSV